MYYAQREQYYPPSHRMHQDAASSIEGLVRVAWTDDMSVGDGYQRVTGSNTCGAINFKAKPEPKIMPCSAQLDYDVISSIADYEKVLEYGGGLSTFAAWSLAGAQHSEERLLLLLVRCFLALGCATHMNCRWTYRTHARTRCIKMAEGPYALPAESRARF